MSSLPGSTSYCSLASSHGLCSASFSAICVDQALLGQTALQLLRLLAWPASDGSSPPCWVVTCRHKLLTSALPDTSGNTVAAARNWTAAINGVVLHTSWHRWGASIHGQQFGKLKAGSLVCPLTHSMSPCVATRGLLPDFYRYSKACNSLHKSCMQTATSNPPLVWVHGKTRLHDYTVLSVEAV